MKNSYSPVIARGNKSLDTEINRLYRCDNGNSGGFESIKQGQIKKASFLGEALQFGSVGNLLDNWDVAKYLQTCEGKTRWVH
jgi:hypothetical protein